MRKVRVIDDIETLRAMAEPTRAAMLELLAKPRSVTELAKALDVPRTRLYHHIEILVDKGLVEQVDERHAGALTERIYALTAKTFRASQRLLREGDVNDRVNAVTTLMLDTTKSDLKRFLLDALERGQETKLGVGRSIAFLTEEEAKRFVSQLDALVAAFDEAHGDRPEAKPYALMWALYPSSRRIE